MQVNQKVRIKALDDTWTRAARALLPGMVGTVEEVGACSRPRALVAFEQPVSLREGHSTSGFWFESHEFEAVEEGGP